MLKTLYNKYNARLLIIITIILIIGVFYAARHYYNGLFTELKDKTYFELQSISKLKSDQISNWYADEINDANIIAHNPLLLKALDTYLSNKNEENKKIIDEILHEIILEHGVDRIFIIKDHTLLFDTEYDSIIFFNSYHNLHPFPDTATGSDIHTHNVLKSECIDFVSPVKIQNQKLHIIFQQDANSFLLPYVSSSPSLSISEESILAQKEEDSVFILNSVKDSLYSNKRISLSIKDTNIAAVSVSLGNEGRFKGLDYKKTPIYAYLSKVKNTPWSLVTKINRREVTQSMYEHLTIVIIFGILITAFLIFGIAFLFSNKQRKLYRNLFHSHQIFKTTLYSIGDGVITTDKKGRIKNMNLIAENLTGWKESDATGKFVEDVFNIVNELTREKVTNPVSEVLEKGDIIELANHTILIHTNGSEIPIADSGAPIRNELGELIGVVLVFRDQSIEYEKQKIIIEAHRKLSSLIENLHGIVYQYHFENEWTLNLISENCYDITGYTKEEFLSKQISQKELIYPEDKENVEKTIQIALHNKHRYKIEYRIISKNGSEIWLWEQGSGVYDSNEKLIAIEGYATDITYQKNLIFELEQSQIFLELILDTIPSKVYWKNKELQFLGGNKNFLQDAHVNSAFDIIGKTDFDMEWHNNAEYYQDIDKKVINTLTPIINNEEEIIIDTNKSVFFKSSIMPLINNKGEVEGILGVYDDITQLKEAEKQIKLQIRAIEQSPVSIVITDFNGVIAYANPKFCEITGYNITEVLNQNPRVLKSGDQSEEFYKQLWDTISSGKDWTGELHNKKKNGDLYWEQAVISPISDIHGKITHYVAIKEDVTERKKINDELVIAKDKAEESNRLKSAFLANISHEIRTPMNGIIGFSEMLADKDLLAEKREEYANIVINSSRQLLTIVNDILDISKIEAGEIRIIFEKFALNSFLYELFQFFKPQTIKKGLKLHIHTVFDDDDCYIETDKNRLRQIFVNLIGNAIKFTHEGEIAFGYTLEKNGIRFFVTDTGIGIKKEMQENVFERFRQAELDISKQYGGTGLGLSISQKLTQLMGGELLLESEFGKGSRFYFTLPHNESLQITNIVPTIDVGINLENTIILIAEDDDATFQLMEIILQKLHLLILRAKNGDEAIKLCNEIPNIQFVLMDIRMPGTDGITALREIKKTKPHLPIVIQTAYKIDEEKAKAIAAGCDDYLIKPIKKQQLISRIIKFIQ